MSGQSSSTSESCLRSIELWQTVQSGWFSVCSEFAVGPTWIAGCITAENGPKSFMVELSDSRMVKHHLDQIRSSSVDPHQLIPMGMVLVTFPTALNSNITWAHQPWGVVFLTTCKTSEVHSSARARTNTLYSLTCLLLRGRSVVTLYLAALTLRIVSIVLLQCA